MLSFSSTVESHFGHIVDLAIYRDMLYWSEKKGRQDMVNSINITLRINDPNAELQTLLSINTDLYAITAVDQKNLSGNLRRRECLYFERKKTIFIINSILFVDIQ